MSCWKSLIAVLILSVGVGCAQRAEQVRQAEGNQELERLKRDLDDGMRERLRAEASMRGTLEDRVEAIEAQLGPLGHAFQLLDITPTINGRWTPADPESYRAIAEALVLFGEANAWANHDLPSLVLNGSFDVPFAGQDGRVATRPQGYMSRLILGQGSSLPHVSLYWAPQLDRLSWNSSEFLSAGAIRFDVDAKSGAESRALVVELSPMVLNGQLQFDGSVFYGDQEPRSFRLIPQR